MEESCSHPRFECLLKVDRIVDEADELDPDSAVATLLIRCSKCKKPFRFILPPGFHEANELMDYGDPYWNSKLRLNIEALTEEEWADLEALFVERDYTS